jgi:hypothetical protein
LPPVFAAEAHVDRDDAARQTGMARPEEDDLGPIGDLRRHRVELLGEPCLGGPEVEAGQRVERLAQGSSLRGHQHRQLVENPLDLGLLGELCLPPGVAQLDRDDRFHEERLATAGSVVDDALHAAARVRLDGDHVAPATERDDGLLQGPRQLAGMDELVQPGPKPVVGDPDRPAEAAQAR